MSTELISAPAQPAAKPCFARKSIASLQEEANASGLLRWLALDMLTHVFSGRRNARRTRTHLHGEPS